MNQAQTLLRRIAFYLLAFFTGIIVLPATGGVALALMFGGAICPIGGLVKLIGSMLGFDLPISLFDIGAFHLSPALGFPLAVIFGIALYVGGRAVWKVLRKYLAWIGHMKRDMLE